MKILEFAGRLYMAAFWLMLALLYLAACVLTWPMQAVCWVLDQLEFLKYMLMEAINEL